jgi:hypothetical protein
VNGIPFFAAANIDQFELLSYSGAFMDGLTTQIMFARWCREIFFKYMRQHYNLDRLVEYGIEAIPDTTRVINPAWRQLDSQIRRQNGLLSRELLQFAEIHLPQEMETQQVEAYQRKKGQLQQAVEERRQQIEQLKTQRKAVAKHIEIKDLPDKDRFHRLRSEKKTLHRHYQAHRLSGRNSPRAACPREDQTAR